jgi:hypothetical protein
MASSSSIWLALLIYESPIVVEGYVNGANAAEQLARSRSRAILVRHYLEVHFMLEASHIGIVTMGVMRHILLPRDSHDVSQCISQIHAG